jgi:hypothetical protein
MRVTATKSFLLLLTALTVALPCHAQDSTPPDPDREYQLGEVDTPPRLGNAAEVIAALQRLDPLLLRNAGAGDTLSIQFSVGTDGRTSNVRALAPREASGFADPIVEAFSVARFTPAQAEGRPVAVRARQPIVWRMSPDGAGAVIEMGEVARTWETARLWEVEELPSPANRSEFARTLAQYYPPELRAARTAGVSQ